jgi:hypothetical protein
MNLVVRALANVLNQGVAVTRLPDQRHEDLKHLRGERCRMAVPGLAILHAVRRYTV